MISAFAHSPRPQWAAPLLAIAQNAYNDEQNLWVLSQTTDSAILRPLLDAGLITTEGERLSFSDQGSECAVFAVYVVESTLIPEWDDPESFGEALRQVHLSTASRKHKELGARSLVLLHNIYGKDIVRRIALETEGGTVFPSLYASFVDALPHLVVDTPSLIDALTQVQKASQRDVLNGLLYNAVLVLCRNQKPTAESLFTALSADSDQPVASFLPQVLSGLSSHDFEDAYNRCTALCHSGNKTLIKYGLVGLSSLEYSSHPEQLSQTLVELDRHLADTDLADALACSYGQFITRPEATRALPRLSALDDQKTWYQLSLILLRDGKQHCEEPWFAEVLLNLSHVTPQQTGTLSNIDSVLYEVGKARPLLLRDFLESYATHGHVGSETEVPSTLQGCFALLCQDLYSSLQDFITRWFDSNSMHLHKMAADFIRELVIYHHITEDTHLCLSPRELQHMSVNDITFTMHKILGYVLDGAVLCSLIFSALKKEPPNQVVTSNVYRVFTEYLGYNYPGATERFLQQKITGPDAIEARIAEEARAAIAPYYEQRRTLARLKEFEPPSDRVRAFFKSKTKILAKVMKENENRPGILSLATRIPLKGGRSWFSERDGLMGEPSMLSEFSQEMEVPRSITIDPLGFEFKRLMWRAEER